MKRLLVAFLFLSGASNAQDVLIRHATVHTAGSHGTLRNADVLVQGGIIRAVGANLLTPVGVKVFEANGKALTPGLFGGMSDIGLEEVSGEKSTIDSTLTLVGNGPPQMRPEFDVTLYSMMKGEFPFVVVVHQVPAGMPPPAPAAAAGSKTP